MTRQLNGQVELYVDGELQEVQKSDDGVKPLTIHSIGRREDKNGAGDNVGYSYFHGAIDQVKIFDKRLTPETVAYLFRFDTPAPKDRRRQLKPHVERSGIDRKCSCE